MDQQIFQNAQKSIHYQKNNKIIFYLNVILEISAV